MNLEQQLKNYDKTSQITPKEENIKKAIRKSTEIFYSCEQKKTLTYFEFLITQLKHIQKRWWCFQLLFLLALWSLLISNQGGFHMQRSIGVISSLFVILIIPELWKNRTYQCMEVEAASYYSLRQIFSARLLLFGIVDILLISAFCIGASKIIELSFSELLVQFLFPMTITACICFGILYSKYSFSENTAIALCLVWSVIWWRIILIEKIYSVITLPIWIALFITAIAFLSITVYRTFKFNSKYWEVKFNGIKS